MGEASPNDAQLVRRSRDGDTAAFGRLVERHQDYIYNAVFHLVGDELRAESLAQEVFVRAFEALDGFEGRAKFTTWIYGIMLNTVRSFWRRSGRRTVFSLDRPAGDDAPRPYLPAEGDGPVEAALRREDLQAVRGAIGDLEDEMREIIVLRDIQGLKYEELAEALDLPLGTVKSRLYRARRSLKEKLEDYYGDRNES